MGISHGSSRQHVTLWSIFGNGRCPGSQPKAVRAGLGCTHQHTPLSYWQHHAVGPGTLAAGTMTEQMITGSVFHSVFFIFWFVEWKSPFFVYISAIVKSESKFKHQS